MPQAQAAQQQLKMRQCRFEATASDSNSPKVHRREAGGPRRGFVPQAKTLTSLL
jgi:hypothetical protein